MFCSIKYEIHAFVTCSVNEPLINVQIHEMQQFTYGQLIVHSVHSESEKLSNVYKIILRNTLKRKYNVMDFFHFCNTEYGCKRMV